MEGDQLGGCHSHAGKGDGRTLFTSTRRNSPEQSIGERDKPTMQQRRLVRTHFHRMETVHYGLFRTNYAARTVQEILYKAAHSILLFIIGRKC